MSVIQYGSAKRDIHAKPTASREAVQLWDGRMSILLYGSAKRDIYAKPTASREAVQLWGLRNTRVYWFREAGHPYETHCKPRSGAAVGTA